MLYKLRLSMIYACPH